MSDVAPPEVSAGPAYVAVTLDWSDADGVDARHVNQVIAQLGVPAPDGAPDGIYIALGSLLPPVVLGDDEERRRALDRLQGTPVKVTVHGRFHMSRGLLEALIQLLQTTATQYDAAVHDAEAAKGKDQG